MSDRSNDYEVNYKSALSFLKQGLKEQAFDCLNMAYSQVSSEHKTVDNVFYLNILSNLSALSLEKTDKSRTKTLIEEGLSVKKDHADFLFLKSLLLMDENRYDEMLEAIIHYLLSLEADDISLYNYMYTHEGVLIEIYDNLLPVAYKYAFQHSQIGDVVSRMCEATGNRWLVRAHEIMVKIDSERTEKGHS
ncbi:MAG TPA: hypothetical protein DDX84_07905 [Nitrospiraceae bacterium]|nr:MAG: hypothetical protein A2035_07440 [Nitrospirae bacterium GWA2_42_11]HBI24106.1 hypothetical protein [Nitrospiraceae bacterium]